MAEKTIAANVFKKNIDTVIAAIDNLGNPELNGFQEILKTAKRTNSIPIREVRITKNRCWYLLNQTQQTAILGILYSPFCSEEA